LEQLDEALDLDSRKSDRQARRAKSNAGEPIEARAKLDQACVGPMPI